MKKNFTDQNSMRFLFEVMGNIFNMCKQLPWK